MSQQLFFLEEVISSAQRSNWVLILGWPGLDYAVYPVKLTRIVTLASLQTQFSHHVVECPCRMDNVLYCLKNKLLGVVGIDYQHFLERYVFNFLSLREYLNFEDYCVEHYCRDIADLFLNKKIDQKRGRIARMKDNVMEKFKKVRDDRRIREAYLQISFAADIRRSRGEIIKILDSIRDDSFCSRY
jgi:hypothetical protein